MVTPGTPDPGTAPSEAEGAAKPIATDAPAPEEPPRGGTQNFHFNYSSDGPTNANWDKLDSILAEMQKPAAEPPAE